MIRKEIERKFRSIDSFSSDTVSCAEFCRVLREYGACEVNKVLKMNGIQPTAKVDYVKVLRKHFRKLGLEYESPIQFDI